jgi:uncharacterized ferredoxin-like protein
MFTYNNVIQQNSVVLIRCNYFYEILKSASLFGINRRAEDVREIEGVILIQVTSRDQVLIRCEFAGSLSAVHDVDDEATGLNLIECIPMC